MSLMERVHAEGSVKRLEEAVQSAVKILDEIQGPLENAPDESGASDWLKKISELREEAKPSRRVIGLLGSTGAGKSSLSMPLHEFLSLTPWDGSGAEDQCLVSRFVPSLLMPLWTLVRPLPQISQS